MYGHGGLGYESRQGQGIYLFSETSNPVQGPHTGFYSVGTGGSCPEVKRLVVKSTIFIYCRG